MIHLYPSIVQLLAYLVSFRLECDNLCKVKSGSGQAVALRDYEYFFSLLNGVLVIKAQDCSDVIVS